MPFNKLFLVAIFSLTSPLLQANPSSSTPTVRVESIKSGAEAAAELSKHDKNKAETKPSEAAPRRAAAKSKASAKSGKNRTKTASSAQPQRVKTKSR